MELGAKKWTKAQLVAKLQEHEAKTAPAPMGAEASSSGEGARDPTANAGTNAEREGGRVDAARSDVSAGPWYAACPPPGSTGAEGGEMAAEPSGRAGVRPSDGGCRCARV